MSELKQMPTEKLALRLLNMQRRNDKDNGYLDRAHEMRRQVLSEVSALDLTMMKLKSDMDVRQQEIDLVMMELARRLPASQKSKSIRRKKKQKVTR